MPELLEYLKSCGIAADRRSVYEDIEALNQSGMEILRQYTGKRGYYLASRLFESPEIGIIADTLRASRYLSKQKTERVLSKLRSLASPMDRNRFPDTHFSGLRRNEGNSSVLYLLDRLNAAVQDRENCTVEFFYFRLDYHKRREMQNGGLPIRGRPEMLLWKDGVYYLVIRNEELKYSHYPVEQIVDLRRLPPFPEQSMRAPYQLELYEKSMIGMTTGCAQCITLRCHKSAADDLFRDFGVGLPVYAVDEQSFRTDIHAIPGSDLFAWVLKQEGRVQILGPQAVKDDYLRMLREQFHLYES